MSRRWVVKKKGPPWMMILVCSAVGYAMIIAMIAVIQYSASRH